ncbi:mechanosensitive ion channel [Acaryochloris sp. IP29b_bin.148]|uniref:mechanosensitive ion channel n=1 Tax=Acaryochloris sp. IP29b_bin.148 TaxID=2969218 RepID=UPI00260CC46C|nr:mechanosensitive ion channel [Acaryochloris sp. IP29b_bin.148]
MDAFTHTLSSALVTSVPRGDFILGQASAPSGDVLKTVTNELGKSVPNLLGAAAFLIIGVIVAFFVKWFVQALLSKTDIDNRLARWLSGTDDSRAAANVEKLIASIAFWIVMLFAIVGFLQALQLKSISDPLTNLLDKVIGYLPQIGGAIVLMGVAWVLATVAKLVVVRLLQSLSVDERLNTSTGSAGSQPSVSISETLGNTIYWFIFLLFLLPVLETLKLQGPLQPVQAMVQDILAVLPNVLGAVLIGVAGWFVARIVRMIVTNLLTASGADRWGQQLGLTQAIGGQSLSSLAGSVVYVFILIPFAISAFQALGIAAISEPAVEMLRDVLRTIPRIFTAAVILGVAYILGKIIGDLVAGLLANFGFNNIFQLLGLQAAQEPTDSLSEEGAVTTTRKTPSEIAGLVVLVGTILVFLIPATDVLQFRPLTGVITELLRVLAQVLVGVLVFGIGLYLANLTFNMVSSSGGGQARLVAQAARVAIIALVSAMALQQMGIATNIVNLAFGLLLGAIAVALALAFGFGGMDIAGEQVRKWLNNFESRR